jgi:hypothetical protein
LGVSTAAQRICFEAQAGLRMVPDHRAVIDDEEQEAVHTTGYVLHTTVTPNFENVMAWQKVNPHKR